MIGQFTLFRLWRAANNEDRRRRTGSEERAVPANRKHYEELKTANKELWRRVEELQQKEYVESKGTCCISKVLYEL